MSTVLGDMRCRIVSGFGVPPPPAQEPTEDACLFDTSTLDPEQAIEKVLQFMASKQP